MLVINRTGPKDDKPGEWTTIEHAGEKLRFQVHRVSGNQVYLAFDAPLSFRIVRDDAVKQERRDG